MMKIKWERNNKVMGLVASGLIDEENVIPRTTTWKFEGGTATVRMTQVSDALLPWVSVHIRGKATSKKAWDGSDLLYATTMRVNFGRQYKHYSLSGELDEDIDFSMVDRVIKKIKQALEGLPKHNASGHNV